MPRRALFKFASLLLIATALGWQSPDGSAGPEQEPQERPPLFSGPPRVSTTVQLPTFGVAIDAEGVLQAKAFRDANAHVHRQRVAAAMEQLPQDLARRSEVRKVSLSRLERTLEERLAEGKEPDEVMRHLAGLQRVDFVFCYPESGEIVLAGPAEAWVADPSGRAVGITSGLPALRLDDLLVALRAYPPGGQQRPFIGCTIDPSAEGLSRLVQFQSTVPRSVSNRQKRQVLNYVAQGTQQALGMADIRTFGIPARSHMARVLVEADYRMKRIGIGLEPPPVKMHTYLSLMRTPKHGTLKRWWFTPDYQCLRVSDDRLAVQFVGQGVQLLTENKAIGPGGKLMQAQAEDGASERFCAGFTAKYPELAKASPLFAELRSAIDLIVAAAFLQRADFYGKSRWRPGVLMEESQLAVETQPEMKQVPAVVNAIWRGSRLLAPAGGGVSIHAHQALAPENLYPDSDGQLREKHALLFETLPKEQWWWD